MFVIQLAICAREFTPSLFIMLRICVATVGSEMKRRAPICLLLKPSATNRATSTSRFASGPASMRSVATSTIGYGQRQSVAYLIDGAGDPIVAIGPPYRWPLAAPERLARFWHLCDVDDGGCGRQYRAPN